MKKGWLKQVLDDVKTSRRESVCAEADRLVSEDRRNDYGHPFDDYSRTVAIFNALTGWDLTPEEGILFMVCVKLSREAHKPKRDNRVDACGYLKCLDIAHEKRAEIEKGNRPQH